MAEHDKLEAERQDAQSASATPAPATPKRRSKHVQNERETGSEEDEVAENAPTKATSSKRVQKEKGTSLQKDKEGLYIFPRFSDKAKKLAGRVYSFKPFSNTFLTGLDQLGPDYQGAEEVGQEGTL